MAQILMTFCDSLIAQATEKQAFDLIKERT